jgi:putative hydrolase of the HAD superfamily
MIKAIIFDLDMCILNTLSLTGSFFDPVLNVLRNSDLTDEQKEKIESQLWTTSLDDTVKMFDVPQALAENLSEAYRQIEVPEGIKSYGDERYIKNLPVKNILVTSGYTKFQTTKIDKLKIAVLFDNIIIDALDEPSQRKGKKQIFEELLQKNHWNANEVLVIGDNPSSELGTAKSLGITTVQTLRPTITKWDDADYHIANFKELQGIINERI